MATEPKPIPKWKIDTIEAAIQDLQRLKVPITASQISQAHGTVGDARRNTPLRSAQVWRSQRLKRACRGGASTKKPRGKLSVLTDPASPAGVTGCGRIGSPHAPSSKKYTPLDRNPTETNSSALRLMEWACWPAPGGLVSQLSLSVSAGWTCQGPASPATFLGGRTWPRFGGALFGGWACRGGTTSSPSATTLWSWLPTGTGSAPPSWAISNGTKLS